MFERPLLLWLLLAAPIAALPALRAIRSERWLSAGLSAALRALIVVVLVATMAGLRLRTRVAARNLAVIAVLDHSGSVAPDQRRWMRGWVEALGSALGPGDKLAVIGFGRDARPLAPLDDPRLLGPIRDQVDSGATDIEGALIAAQSLFPPESSKKVVLLSDGNQTEGDALAEVPALLEEGIRVYAEAPPPSATERTAITYLRAPESIRAGELFTFRLGIESEAREEVEAKLRLTSDGESVGRQSLRLKPGLNRLELPWRFERPGARLMSFELSVAPPQVTLNGRAEAAVSVSGPPRVLVVSSSRPESLTSALELRNYRLQIASPRSLSDDSRDYLSFQAVILADVRADALPAAAQRALRSYVADMGGGLVVTGEALREEKFAGSALEQTLPVTFRPQPPPPSREPIAIYLCIDRSNSMSYDSRYPAVRDGERIRYAKKAAIALLRQLDDTDYAGVIAFDSQPYVLGHLEPLGGNRAQLESRIARLQPGGGTDFKEALEIAEREIVQSGIPVRQVMLLTDGDTNRQYHDHDQLITSYARRRIPLSTIRIGPDVANLRLLQDFAQATSGLFYRVQDIEKLPLLLVGLTRKAMSRRRHGVSTIIPGEPSAILTGIKPAEIPPIDFFASTRAKERAQVPLRITTGAKSVPLLAAWQYGLGRSVAFAADPDSLATLSWIRWNRYAEFWSQLVSWVMRRADPGTFSIRVLNAADGSGTIEAEKADPEPVDDLVCRVTGHNHAFEIAMTQVGGALYRGELGPLERGKYVATLMVKSGDTEHILARHEFAAVGSPAPDARELRIRPPNLELLRRLSLATHGAYGAQIARIVRRVSEIVTVRRSVDNYLLPIAILLILMEVFVRRRFLAD